MLRHLVVKFDFWAFSSHFPPFPPKQWWFFYFFDCTDHSAYTTLNWGAGGIRELTLGANKVEKCLSIEKCDFLNVSQLLLSLIVWKLFMQTVSISFIYPSSSKFIFTKVTKCVVQSDSWLKKKWQVIFSHRNSDAKTKPGVSHEWINPYLALKGVSIATFSLLKRSKSVYLTFIQRNSHYDIMATSVSLHCI